MRGERRPGAGDQDRPRIHDEHRQGEPVRRAAVRPRHLPQRTRSPSRTSGSPRTPPCWCGCTTSGRSTCWTPSPTCRRCTTSTPWPSGSPPIAPPRPPSGRADRGTAPAGGRDDGAHCGRGRVRTADRPGVEDRHLAGPGSPGIDAGQSTSTASPRLPTSANVGSTAAMTGSSSLMVAIAAHPNPGSNAGRATQRHPPNG